MFNSLLSSCVFSTDVVILKGVVVVVNLFLLWTFDWVLIKPLLGAKHIAGDNDTKSMTYPKSSDEIKRIVAQQGSLLYTNTYTVAN